MNYTGSYGIGYKAFMETPYTPIAWIVEGLLPVGLSIIAGKPKAGKIVFVSILQYALQMAINSWGGILIRVKYSTCH